MKKELAGLLAIALMLSIALSACGDSAPSSQPGGTDPTENAGPTETTQRPAQEPTDAPTEEPTEGDPEFEVAASLSYTITQKDLGADNIFNEDGIAWIEVTGGATSAEYNALVNTNGEILYFSDPRDFDCSRASQVTTSVFVNGLSAVYVSGKPGFRIVDGSGVEVYGSSDEDLYMCGHMGDGNFLLLRHDAGFDHDDWIVNVLDADLTLRDTGVRDSGTLYKDEIVLLDEGVYCVEDRVLNVNYNFYDPIPGTYLYHNDETLFLKEVRNVFRDYYIYTVPLATYLNATAPLNISKDACAMVGRGGESLYDSDARFSPAFGGCLETRWRDEDGDTVKGYKDFDGSVILAYPKFAEGVTIMGYDDFSGGYSALYITGVDGKTYETIVNEKGEAQYEPLNKLEWTSYSNTSCFGYIFNYEIKSPGEEGLTIIAPDGSEKKLNRDDLTGLEDAYFVKNSEYKSSYLQAAVGNGYILLFLGSKTEAYTTAYYSTDGTGKINRFTANYNSDGNLIYTDKNGEKHIAVVS